MNPSKNLQLLFSVFTLAAGPLAAQKPVVSSKPLSLENWTGFQKSGEGAATLGVPGQAVFQVPAGPLGWHRPTDMYLEHDGTIDARSWYGLRFEIEMERDEPLILDFTLRIPKETERKNFLESSKASLHLAAGKGLRTVTLPFSSFDYNRGQSGFLKFIQQLEINARAGEGRAGGSLKIKNIRLVRAPDVHLGATMRSKPCDASGKAEYPVTITNCSDKPLTVALSLERAGWEEMPATVTPATVSLDPGASREVMVNVALTAGVPPGGKETQTLLATPQGEGGSPVKMEFITLRRLPFPFLVHDAKGWQEVREKVKNHEWAKQQADETLAQATAWQVPEAYKNNRAPDGTLSVFKSYLDGDLRRCAQAYYLSGDKAYAEKLALFLRRLADPATGYPKTLHANSQGIPQEGGFLLASVESYEAIHDAGVLTEADKQLIENTFRLYIGTIIDAMGDGGISNWSVFNLAPAAMCALAIHDLALYEELLNGPCGLVDHLRYGTMDDGWWYEMSLSYNLGCAEEFTRLGIAAEAFGLDLLNRKFPVALSRNVGLRPFEYEEFLGMAFGKFGPVKKQTVTIKQMWDGILIYPDFRGQMFGVGDGHEHFVSGGPFELAYFAFRDPAYASIIKQGSKRDLVHGVEDLPAATPVIYTKSGFSENAGLAVLRSQTPDRQPSEQIQAAFKYGTHGSYHGHFDRISLLALSRNGRNFYNPETSWFGYGSYLYKWWVQPSLSHNMVVVDAKQQEPRECKQLLFHTGPMMQVVAAETIARWANPPYMGGYDQISKVKSGDAPYVPIPENHPVPGILTDFTKPVNQRRAIIVTDDYVVMADDLRAETEHTYDNLLHLRGAKLEESTGVRLLGHQAQLDENPLGSGQFITNLRRFSATAPVRIESAHQIGEGKNLETGGQPSDGIPGTLRLDEHILWPQSPEILIGNYAEAWKVNKKLTYDVLGDGKSLATGTFGAWILGSGKVDTDLTGVSTLELRTTASRGKDGLKTIFWGNPVLVTTDGKEIPLATLTAKSQNVVPAPQAGRDYDGGPVVIAGVPQPQSTAAEPEDITQPAVISFDLTGRNIVRLKTSVGGDWPVGEDDQARKTISVRTKGKEAQFLTLLEPYEEKCMVKSAVATGPGQLRVELVDGRVQELAITGLEGESPVVEIVEKRDGKETRRETTKE